VTDQSEYTIVDIPQDAREDTEQLGSKPKFWVTLADGRWLFKAARPNTGEDWAEKVAAELAKILDVDAAEVELATYVSQRGCISKNFIQRDRGEALIHGNEVLAAIVSGYDKTKIMKQSDHTVDNIIKSLTNFLPDGSSAASLKQLAEFMVFDALIGNTDRHHENWGMRLRLMYAKDSYPFSVAPSYDHASALGRECLNERCEKILRENNVGKYVRAAHGGVYWLPTDAKGVSPLKLVELASAKYPTYFVRALAKICKLSEDDAWNAISRVSADRASDVSKKFAHAIVCYSLTELKRL
jgi:HipA-like C-terminal domain